ncbi:nucleoside recognition domain-containing protein [Anaerovoracaceae bacterium 42-11]
MYNLPSLLDCIFFGEFGLFTLTPRYLFLVLFPVMVLLGIFGQILPKIPFLKETSPAVNQLFYGVIGLGCTTCALAALSPLTDSKSRSRMALILVLLIPCSAQLTLLATFASMVTCRVFLVFLLFSMLFCAVLYLALGLFLPLTDAMVKPENTASQFSLMQVIRDAFQGVCDTAIPFCIGSIIIGILLYFGVLDWLSSFCAPILSDGFHLPPEAASLLLLNVLKRDFGAASLLSFAGSGTFTAAQLLTCVVMMTFSVPCFNSAVLLVKQQKLPEAICIWLGSLLISLLLGKIVCEVLFICGF